MLLALILAMRYNAMLGNRSLVSDEMNYTSVDTRMDFLKSLQY